MENTRTDKLEIQTHINSLGDDIANAKNIGQKSLMELSSLFIDVMPIGYAEIENPDNLIFRAKQLEAAIASMEWSLGTLQWAIAEFKRTAQQVVTDATTLKEGK